MWKSHDIEPNCNLDGTDRIGGYVHFSQNAEPISQANSMYSLIYGNEPLRLLISGIIDRAVYPSDFPIELREYGSDSKGMPCHADIQMYGDLLTNLEIVVTLTNQGSSEMYWYDREGKRRSVHPKANSLTIVHPSAAVHCVTPTRGGPREILKFIMVGSYAKSEWFNMYVDNICGITNPNVQAVRQRSLGGEYEEEL